MKQGTSKLLLFISVAIVIAVVLLELTLAKIVRYTTTYSSGFDLTFFGSIVIPLIAFGYIIIICSRVITRDIIRKNTPNLQLLQRTVIISTVICSILLSYIWIEMFMYSKYTIIFVISVIGISIRHPHLF